MFLIANFVDPNQIKEKITQTISEKTGRTLTIAGDMHWSFFPWLGIKAQGITMGNPEKFSHDVFAKIDELDIEVRALPLIHGEIQSGKVTMQHLDLTLVRNKAGITNWDDLVSRDGGNPAKKAAITVLSIANVAVQNANVILDDQQNKKKVVISNIGIQGQNINVEGTPFNVMINCDVSAAKPFVKGNFTFDGTFTLDFANQLYNVRNLQISGQVQNEQMVKPLAFAAQSDINVDIDKQILNLPNLTLKIGAMTANGKLNATNIINAPQVIGNLETNAFDLKPLLNAFGLAKNVAQDAMQNASLKLAIQTTSKFLKIPNLEIKFDDTVITGKGSYSHFLDKYIVFNLDINKIDFDKYLQQNIAPAATATAQTTQGNTTSARAEKNDKSSATQDNKKTNKKKRGKNVAAKNSADDATSSDAAFSSLRDFILDGDLRIADFKLNNLYFKNFSTVLSGNHGVIDLNPISCNLYNGKANGNMQIDVRKPTLQFATKFNAANIAVQSMLKQLIGKDKISGTGYINADLNAKGNNLKTVISNLNGNGKITLAQGTFYGFDIHEQIDRAQALINQKPIAPAKGEPKTFFGQLSANFKLNNGSFTTNDLLIQAPDFKVTGKGSANLAAQALNMQLNAYGLINFGKKANFYVPIKITNTFTEPKFSVDFSNIGGQILDNKVSEQIGEQLQKHGIDKNTSHELIKSLHLNKIIQ